MLAFYKNTLAVLVLAPLVIFLANRYGAVGAATTGMILNGGYILIEIPIMHRRVLKGEMRRWYIEDVGLPLVAALSVAGLARWLLPTTIPAVALLSALAAATVAALLAAGLAASRVRAWAFEQAARLKVAYGQ